jgi:hypothetical protein
MPDSLATLRELVEKNRPGPTTPKYMEDIRKRVADYVHQQRLLNVTYTVLSKQIGLSPTTLAKWVRKYKPPKPVFLPVQVRDTQRPQTRPDGATFSITSPNGWLIQGLDIDALTALIGRMQ